MSNNINHPSAIYSSEEALELLKQQPASYSMYCRFSKPWKERFLKFMEGKKTPPLTYDPFFKYIFDPDVHRDRLESFISSLLDMNVKVMEILSSEDRMMAAESFLIMDLLVQLEDGSLCNVEIQKQPYGFPAERISCYSADLLMRQYSRVKGERGKDFTYKDIKKVYVIVIYENSTNCFHTNKGKYIHTGKVAFDTHLELELLQEYLLIALDVFSKTTYPKLKNTQTAWLSLLTTENMQDVDSLIEEYPWMEQIYEEIAMLRHNPKEVLEMWSDALRQLDENTLKYLTEEQAEQICQQIDRINQQNEVIDQQTIVINQQDETINQQGKTIDQQTIMINQQDETINQQGKTIDQQTIVINQQDETINQQGKTIDQQAKEIAELKKKLAEAGL